MTTTRRLEVGSLLLLAILVLGACDSELPRPSYTRTMLKVSRSLPGETEELKVRTSEGNLATLIVKRRDKPSLSFNDSKLTSKPPQEESSANVEKSNSSKLDDDKNDAKKKDEVRRLEEAQVDQIRATFSKSFEAKDDKVDVSRIEKDRSQPISLIDYGNWTPLDVNGRTLRQEQSKDEEEREVEEYRNWKPLQTTPETTSEDRTGYDRFNEAGFASGILLARHFQDRTQRNLELEDHGSKNERALYYTYVPQQSRPVTRTNVGANLSKNRDGKAVPPEVIVRSEINVKTVPKRSAMSLDSDGTPVIHGTRVPDEPIDKVQTWRNARVINNKLIAESSSTASVEPTGIPYSNDNAEKKLRFEKFFKDVNRRYGRNYDDEGRNVYFEWDPRNYKNEALNAEVYETRNDQYRSSVHKRMLHPDSVANYPISQRYTPNSQTIAPVALKSGARAPVLQYAHPELGVQPAKILKNEKRRPDNFPENQHSFTEQRHKKKYVLNDKNIVDYTTKNYYPNQYFYGLKRPNEPPFWVKISENLKNQFSTGVERVSQFTRPVIDPLVEATHKISQNLGLSKGKEAQDKIGTVTSGTSILIPALGLVASGAALGIGAVAVGRYLDVDVLKRSTADDIDLEHKRALEMAGENLRFVTEGNIRLNEATPQTLYVLHNVPTRNDKEEDESASSTESDGVFLVLEEDRQNTERVENRDSRQLVDEKDYVETNGRRRRSLDYLDIFRTENNMRNLVRSKRFQRKGADSISEIVEIDLPDQGPIDITDFLLPNRNKERGANKGTILVVEDDSAKTPSGNLDVDVLNQQSANQRDENTARDGADNSRDATLVLSLTGRQRRLGQEVDDALSLLGDTSRILGHDLAKGTANGAREIAHGSAERIDMDHNGRRKRSLESDQELEDVLQNLENAEVAEVAHVQGDWTNTPCAKRIFCDTMIQKGPDAAVLMEKKMAALLRLIQPGAAIHVSSHFEEVMQAIRRHDCSSFLCPQARPGNVFF